MEYPVSAPSSPYLQPITLSAWLYSGFPVAPLPYDPTHVPGCTLSSHPVMSPPPGPSTLSFTAPMPTVSSHQESHHFVSGTRVHTPTEDSQRRTLRRRRQNVCDMLDTWAGYMKTNYTRIPTQDAMDLIRPFGQIPHEAIGRYWTLPQVDLVAYVIHCNVAGEYSTSYGIFIPSLSINLIPFTIASLIEPSLEHAEPDEILSPELGTLPIRGELTITSRLGNSYSRLSYYASEETQVVILGAEATSAFGLAFCPIRLCLVTSSGQPLDTIRVPFRWFMSP